MNKITDIDIFVAMHGANSSRVETWLCVLSHEWKARIIDVRKGQGCPYCANKKVLEGYNDLSTTHPNLASEWDSRNELLPTQVTAGSRKKVWWSSSECNHTWEQPIKARKAGKGCPLCSGKIVIEGTNDLVITHPDIAKEWSPNNVNKKPTSYTYGSTVKVLWLCEQGHEWESSINNRTARAGNKCPYCSNKKVLVGYNDLQTTHPDLSKEWHSDKNLPLTSTMITAGSKTKIWWVCEKDTSHVWFTSPSERTLHRTGCPFETQVSKAEVDIVDFLRSQGLQVEPRNRSKLPPYEIDIYLPELSIGIEYHGLYWHSEDKRGSTLHYNKWAKAQENNITLLQVWEDDWLYRQPIVKNMLLSKIGRSNQRKIYARQTFIAPVNKAEADDLLDANHIQGKVNGSIRLGLYSRQTTELFAVLVLKRETKTRFLITRYATSVHLVGGFSKLITYLKRDTDFEELVTFSDNMISGGSLYANNGFTLDKVLPSDYYYISGGRREHKFNFRLQRFRDDDNLIWEDNQTEFELANLNSLNRIWDAGKKRWVLKITR